MYIMECGRFGTTAVHYASCDCSKAKPVPPELASGWSIMKQAAHLQLGSSVCMPLRRHCCRACHILRRLRSRLHCATLQSMRVCVLACEAYRHMATAAF